MRSLLLVFIFMCGNLWAAPILNRNMSFGSDLILWQDHLDKNVFYYLPSSIQVVERYHWGFALSKNEMKVAFTQNVDKVKLERSKKALLAHYPKAVLVQYELNKFMVPLKEYHKDFFREYRCINNKDAKEYIAYCIFQLTQKGVDVLIPFLKNGKILPLNYVYAIDGVLELADGTFKKYVQESAIPMYLGGDVVVNDPDMQAFRAD